MESLFLCENFIAAQDNKASIIGIFDLIYADKLPMVYGRAFLVGVITGEPNSQHNLKVVVENAEGEEIFSNVLPSNFGKNGRTTMAQELIGMPITKLGKIKFKLFVDEVEVGHSFIEVSNQPAN